MSVISAACDVVAFHHGDDVHCAISKAESLVFSLMNKHLGRQAMFSTGRSSPLASFCFPTSRSWQ